MNATTVAMPLFARNCERLTLQEADTLVKDLVCAINEAGGPSPNRFACADLWTVEDSLRHLDELKCAIHTIGYGIEESSAQQAVRCMADLLEIRTEALKRELGFAAKEAGQ